MELFNSVEIKQLTKLNEKFLSIAETAHSYTSNVKAMKLCLKLVKLEIKQFADSKQPVDKDKSDKILGNYIKLQDALKGLIKTKKVQDTYKYTNEIEEMIAATKKKLVELMGMNAVDNISQKGIKAIRDTAQKIGDKLSDKLGDAVGGTIENIKKHLTAEED